ncbi:phosphotransferase family protein [Penicillium canescens]|uniref:Phosphotransferase family protein n=1 Tax=Penicillium canescens TaxID=5083 RepID=A0AAD6IC89_PENCN|nr:phosphotransferase family protein [Penicillium canescens]KAJ6043294.1 phosphotransferase family protein [Penicillium canescens]KAJ6054769.1 phosphotransferase family protein [Penicillium canescens]KAJ6073713.1 phosphotransferase family protein [Penicillium canescens]
MFLGGKVHNEVATIRYIQENITLKLWCDDVKPSNVLLYEKLQIVGLIDWEFTYAAPTAISSAPPWWLLIEQPDWPYCIEAWMKVRDYRLQAFLKVLIKHEDALLRYGQLEEGQILSGPMRKNLAFDAIFWQKLDPRFFGSVESPGDAWLKGLSWLLRKRKKSMESLVEHKL